MELDQEVARLFHQMRSQGFCLDETTIVNLLSCFASLGDLQTSSSLHAYRSFSCENVYISAHHLYAKCGEIKTASSVFDDMSEKITISWNVLTNAYEMQGDCNGSITAFYEEKLNPTDATFTAILSACSHSGKIEGWKLVDLLSHSGQLEEAFNFINVSLFGSFLRGCSLHSRFDLGKTSVKWIRPTSCGCLL